MGNNLNQIARQVNAGSGHDRVQVVAALMAIDAGLERCIMPTSEHPEDMVVLAWQTGAYVFCFVDRAQHLAMMKSIGMYDERLNSDEKATYYFTGKNPAWERDKPAGMKLCDYLYRKLEQFAIENGVQVVDAGKC